VILTFLAAIAFVGWLVRTGAADASVSTGGKSIIRGLVVMPSQQPYNLNQPFPVADPDVIGPDGSAFTAIAVDATWAQLEPAPGHYTWGPFDRSLASVRKYNLAHSHDPLAVKVRVFGGYGAPDWAKQLGGRPVTIADRPNHARNGTLGRWWTKRYNAAWATFQRAMARRYDGNPLIRGVQDTSCNSETDEPFIVPNSTRDSVALAAVGYSTSDQKACLLQALPDFAAWELTPVYLSVNLLQDGTSNGMPLFDQVFSEHMVDLCVASHPPFGPTCVVDNHDLRAGVTTNSQSTWLFASIDREFAAQPSALHVAFQAYDPTQGADCTSIDIAIAAHASSVELWAPQPVRHGYQGFRSQSSDELNEWNSSIVNGRLLPCPTPAS